MLPPPPMPLPRSPMFRTGRLFLTLAALQVLAAFLIAPWEVMQWRLAHSKLAETCLTNSLTSAALAILTFGCVVIALNFRMSRLLLSQLLARLLLAGSVLPLTAELARIHWLSAVLQWSGITFGASTSLLDDLISVGCGIWAIANMILTVIVLINIPNIITWTWTGRLLYD